MQKESSTVASSMFSRMNEAKQVLSRLGWNRALPRSFLTSLISMYMGKIRLMVAKESVGMIQGR